MDEFLREKNPEEETAHWVSKNLRKFPRESAKGAVSRAIAINNTSVTQEGVKSNFSEVRRI